MDRLRAENSARRVACGLDQRSAQRVAWTAHVARTVLRLNVEPSTIIRAALEHFVLHVERALEGPGDDGAKQRALAVRFRRAARGCTDALHPEHLLQNPPLPFWQIERDARGGRPPRLPAHLVDFGDDPDDCAP